MILRHSDWAGLVAEVRARAPELARVPDPLVRAVLAAPAAIAAWIARRMQQLLSQPCVSILVLGAETADAVDEGRWYQYIPMLLDASFALDVTLVGSELDVKFESAAASHAPAKCARSVRTRLDAFLSNASEQFDLAFAFHPGLQKHRGWLDRDAFGLLLERNVPLVCAAFGRDEYEVERWVVESYGYKTHSMPIENPFFLDLSDTRTSIRWGSVLWRLEAAPASYNGPDEERLAALETLNRMVMHSMSVRAPALPYGAEVELARSDGGRLRLVHAADQRFVDLRSGEVWSLEGADLKKIMLLPVSALASYPGAASSEIQRAIWAARVKADYLLASYPRALEAEDSGLAAQMLAELKQKLTSSFKK